MKIDSLHPFHDNAIRAHEVYETLHNRLQQAQHLYVGGTTAMGEAGFLCKIFPSLTFIDDHQAGSTLFNRPVISTAEFAKQVRSSDFLINNCISSPGFNHFSRQALSLGVASCNVVEALATFHDKGMVMNFSGQTSVYGPAFHRHTLDNLDRYIHLRDRLHDALSLQTFDNLLNYRLTGNPNFLASVAVGYNYGTLRHDSYILNAQFFTLSENEVFIDAGALNGASSAYFLRSVKGKFDRIVMFEPAADSVERCHACVEKLEQEFPEHSIKDKIDIVAAGLYNHTGNLSLTLSLFDSDITAEHGAMPQSAHFLDTGLSHSFVTKGEEYKVTQVPVTTLDDYLGNDPATFIKYEIEGSEVAALEGATKTILRNKPKMALSIYHRPQDLELIMDYVHNLGLNYKMALRAHNPHTPDAIVLYCWI